MRTCGCASVDVALRKRGGVAGREQHQRPGERDQNGKEKLVHGGPQRRLVRVDSIWSDVVITRLFIS